MVLFTMIEIGLEAGFWFVKKTYHVGYWLFWGSSKTKTETKIEYNLEIQNQKLKQIHQDLIHISERLQHLESFPNKIKVNESFFNPNNADILEE